MAEDNQRELTPCPLCAATSWRSPFLLKSYTLVECASCRLLYVRDRLREEEMTRFYGEHYFSSSDELSQGYSDYQQMGIERKATFNGYLKRILPYLRRREQVLDIGCGYGYFLNAARTHFRKLAGNDLSREALQQVDPAFDTQCGQFRADLYPQHFADLVMMCDFVEHLYHPVDFLREVRKVLHPEGILCLVTPNRNSLLSRVSGKRWVSFKLPEHICYYDPETITRLLAETGFQPVRIMACGQRASLEFIAKRLGQLVMGSDWGRFIPRRMRRLTIYVNSGSMMVLARPVQPDAEIRK
jgi:2-polyprenyl-3-methyl-5-hydroxy-6-metoxy-1,4-benzoquinol methylase